MWWQDFLDFVTAHKVGDLASIAGVVISIIGFAVTLVGVLKSKKAAERAEESARGARESIRGFEVVVDFTAAISKLEELKRAHRAAQWQGLPDEYASIRKLLINIRIATPTLTDSQSTVIQQALSNLHLLEATVERGLSATGVTPNTAAKLNAILSKDVDELIGLLGELKMKSTGG